MNTDQQQLLDQEHLRLLSLFYYISAGIAAFFAFFPAIYIVVGMIFITISSRAAGHSKEVPPEFVGWFMVIIGVVASLIIFAIAVIKFLTGKWIKERKHRTFCLIVAGLSCLSMPYGTVLGVFTFMVLLRKSVESMFIQNRETLDTLRTPAPT